MTDSAQSTSRRPAAITLGLVASLVFAGIFLLAGLWEPVAALPLAAILLAVTYGVYKRHAWSAYGGALLLIALGSRTAVRLFHVTQFDGYNAGVATSIACFALAAFALFRAARSMPRESTPGARSLWIALAALVVVCPQFCRAYVIASGSMESTIRIGDRVLILPVTKAPGRGDIVMFRYPVDGKQSFLKRVVAVGGDRVQLRDKQLLVNGVPVKEPYAIHQTDYVDPFRDNFPAVPNTELKGNWAEQLRANTVNGELVVPPGKFFVLGDNRDNSLDSRYFGFLDSNDFSGKPVLIYFSADTSGGKSQAPALLHPSRIRWSRMFKEL